MNVLIPLLLALAAQDATPPAESAAPAASEPAAREEAPIPDKVHASPEGDVPPAVTIRTEANGDRVEEYRQNGVLYMVKVTPERGVPYYLMDTDGNGRFNRNDGPETVAPVYWTIYEWD
ncbi:DUF2782 domain-containing protein [Arenimonas donghaensis]|uniref:DUF2782 domain-containing protein n=1 Tax=Arenimonas donghaensis DSM 18148 = HO3-R19 TaxID=1121014 RepID=A0A087MHG9_9GAMM|nr:DUF2782 domain-containing protein [Arenimonas donghaensis]KFL36322.1 hypothetical protein N788_05365 [Arenimonas donghaensis DSM 18148 = HO3-R19]